MKIVLFLKNEEKENVKEIIEYFVAYGYNDIILFVKDSESYFSKSEKNYFITNDIKLTVVNSIEMESTSQKLLYIKGSLDNTFLLVYSNKIIFADLDKLCLMHKNETNLATLLIHHEKMIACLLENEIFDYSLENFNFEKEILKRVGQDLELNQIEV
ncbi:MAG: hypothetical protein IJW54_06355 [Clostridia bacterium]|nr:hypothetical protein [Clostridia bacterium]